MRATVLVTAVSILLAMASWACDDDGNGSATDAEDTADLQSDVETDGDDDVDLVEEPDTGLPIELPPGTDDDFAPLCTEDWDAALEPAQVEELNGEFIGWYPDWPAGTLEIMQVTPEHAFHATTLRVAFHGSSGPVRLHLTRTIGQSYPDLSSADGALIPPIEMDVESPSGDDWIDIDISEHNVFLQPGVPYAIAYEHLAASPFLAVEDLPEGVSSRGLMIIPGEDVPYGVGDGQFRMMLEGDYFCTFNEEDLWFEEDVDQPFYEVASEMASFADLNGDGHDDLIVNAGGPIVYFGDGSGGFAEADFDPFPDLPAAGAFALFGDVDNDGDRDAFVTYYVSIDADGDRVESQSGDCDDTNDQISPNRAEIPGNGIDDDCDGTADDGTNTDDADGDGVTIADGDCNDTRADIYPGAPELLDSRDNDCDGQTDEDFHNVILLNDGNGLFTIVEGSGLETYDNTGAAGFGDGNGDGILDVYWGNWLRTYPYAPAVHDRYFVGNGDGTFTDAASSAGLVPSNAEPSYGVSWNDYNNDGHQDIWVGNYGGSPDFLWRNNGDGTYVEVGRAAGIAIIQHDFNDPVGGTTFGGDWGDIDNDGDMDLFSAHICHPRDLPFSDPSGLFINQGPPDYTFVEQREEYGIVWSEGDVNAAFADFDNDMDLDLAIASLYRGHFARLYRNEGGNRFVDVTYAAGVRVEDVVSPVWSDVDEDGDLDLVLADRTGPERVHLFINRIGQDNNWIALLLEGTTTNRDAIGARVILTAGGVTQMRDVRAGSGKNIQTSLVVHFGLAQNETIERVTVRWVGGDLETITGLEPNGRYRVVEGSGTGVLIP